MSGLARELGMSRTAVYRWAASGYIPCFRFGTLLRFRLSEVLEAQRSIDGRRKKVPKPRRRRVEREAVPLAAPVASSGPLPAGHRRRAIKEHKRRLEMAVAGTRPLVT